MFVNLDSVVRRFTKTCSLNVFDAMVYSYCMMMYDGGYIRREQERFAEITRKSKSDATIILMLSSEQSLIQKLKILPFDAPNFSGVV